MIKKLEIIWNMVKTWNYKRHGNKLEIIKRHGYKLEVIRDMDTNLKLYEAW